MADRLAVLGSPIAHSRSPRIHAAAYEVLGVPWEYSAIECAEAGLEGLLAGSGPEWRGFSVTMPLKEEASRLSAVLDPVAEESGVANTLLRIVGAGAPAWAGFNTDVAGLSAALEESGLEPRRTIVFGAGATAVSAVLAARALGAERVSVLARRASAAESLAARFDGSASRERALAVRGLGLSDPDSPELLNEIAEATAVISTLPGPAGAQLALPEGITAVPLFDVAYDPWPSPLAKRWREAGGEAHPGLAMLVRQALVQVRIFMNGDPGAPLRDEPRVLAAMRAAASRSD